MMKVQRISTPYGRDDRPIEEKLTEFFETTNLSKDHVISIHMDIGKSGDYTAFYIFYDDGK